MLSYFLVAMVLVSTAVLPLVLWRYLQVHVPRRLDEVRLGITDEFAEDYATLFAPQQDHAPEPADLVRSHFESFHATRDYWLAAWLATVVTLIGLGLAAFWSYAKLSGGDSPVSGVRPPLIMAFLGGYVWSLWELFTRIGARDLTPGVLSQILWRLLACVPIGYVVSLLTLSDIASFTAFVASAFPARDARLLLRQLLLKRLKDQGTLAQTRASEDRLGMLVPGISDAALARLEEVQIYTHHDLAYADPLRIVVQTGFPLRQVVDWIDQAIWAYYVGTKINELSRMGLRSALEASHLYRAVCLTKGKKTKPNAAQNELIKALAKVLGIPPRSVVWMLDEVYHDPHVNLISKIWGEEEDDE